MSEIFKIDSYRASGQVNQGCNSCRITHIPSGLQEKAETKLGFSYNKLQAFVNLAERLGEELQTKDAEIEAYRKTLLNIGDEYKNQKDLIKLLTRCKVTSSLLPSCIEIPELFDELCYGCKNAALLKEFKRKNTEVESDE